MHDPQLCEVSLRPTTERSASYPSYITHHTSHLVPPGEPLHATRRRCGVQGVVRAHCPQRVWRTHRQGMPEAACAGAGQTLSPSVLSPSLPWLQPSTKDDSLQGQLEPPPHAKVMNKFGTFQKATRAWADSVLPSEHEGQVLSRRGAARVHCSMHVRHMCETVVIRAPGDSVVAVLCVWVCEEMFPPDSNPMQGTKAGAPAGRKTSAPTALRGQAIPPPAPRHPSSGSHTRQLLVAHTTHYLSHTQSSSLSVRRRSFGYSVCMPMCVQGRWSTPRSVYYDHDTNVHVYAQDAATRVHSGADWASS